MMVAQLLMRASGVVSQSVEIINKMIAQEAEKLTDHVTGWSAPAARTRAWTHKMNSAGSLPVFCTQ
jgi:hypothetical protein